MPFRKIDVNEILQNSSGVSLMPQSSVSSLTPPTQPSAPPQPPSQTLETQKPQLITPPSPEQPTFLEGIGEIIASGTGLKLLTETGKAAASPIAQQAVQDIEASRKKMIDNATSLVQLIRNTADEEKKQKLTQLLNEQISLINEINKSAEQTRQETQTDLGKIVGSTIDPLLTYATLGTGSLGAKTAQTALRAIKPTSEIGTALGEHLLTPALKSTELALTGVGFKVAENLKEGKPIDENLIGAAAIGGAIPVVGKGLSLVKSATTKAIVGTAQLFTDKEALSLAFSRPKVVEEALHYLEQNTKKPFLEMAKNIAYRLEKAHDNAVKTFEKIWEQIPQGKKGQITLNFNDIASIAKKFGIILKEEISPEGRTIEIANRGDILFFPPKALNFLKEITQKLTDQKPLTPLEIKNLKQSLSAGIDFVGSQHQGKKRWDMLISRLNDKLDEKVGQALPELQQANQNYKAIEQVYSYFKNKFIKAVKRDKAGNIIDVIPKETAESTLSNILNVNKGALQKEFGKLEELVGTPIIDYVYILKSAEKLGVNISFLKAAAAKGGLGLLLGALTGATAGFKLGGPAGAMMALTALGLASPKVSGYVARKAGTAQQVIHQQMPQFLKNLIEKAGGGKM